MRNAHGLVTGTSGTGKTTWIQDSVLKPLPRYLVLDREAVYPADRAVEDIERLAVILGRHGAEPRLRLSYQGDHDPGHLAALRMVWETQRAQADPRPIMVVMDEAHLWSSSREIPDELALVIRTGRKHGIAVLSVAQRDVNLHPDVRLNSFVKVAFRQTSGFSDDFRRSWFAGRLERIQALELPDGRRRPRPKKGRHFLTDPAELDPVDFWRRELG